MKYSDKVLEFATKAHEGQTRKYTGVPYITHPIAVAEIAVKQSGYLAGSIIEKISSIAYLHDILEDYKFTKVTESDLREFLLSVVNWDDEVETIMTAVKLLTKKEENFDLFEYLDGIKSNVYAKLVKLADLEHNMSDLTDKKKLDKYKLIKYYLEHWLWMTLKH